MTTRVFVYGTLRSGQHNAWRLRTATKVCDAETRAEFRLWCFGGWPAVTQGGSTTIRGEVWEVDDNTLAQLDALEEVPDVYQRVEVELAGGLCAHIWVMRLDDVADAHEVAGGDWAEHRARSCGGASEE